MKHLVLLAAALLLVPSVPAFAADAPAASKPMARPAPLRGTLATLDGQTLTVTAAAGPVVVTLKKGFKVIVVVPSDKSKITAGSFVGITSMVGPDGKSHASEVHIFPESMRGMGEGDRDWSGVTGKAGSKMTNGTVGGAKPHAKMTNGTVHTQADGSVKIGYKGGARDITIPAGIPVVAFEPGTTADLKAGSHLMVFAGKGPDGKLAADRVMVGKDGMKLPM